MTDRADQDPADMRQDEAISWLLRVQADHAGEADWLGLRNWLEAAPENRKAFDRAEQLWAELDERAAEIAQPAVVRLISGVRRRRPALRWLGPAAIAAGIALAAVLAPLLRPTPGVVYQTGKGETRLVRLADGSQVHLAAASRLTVKLERGARRVSMDDAEAAFDVAKDPNRPFLIAVGDRQVRVVGTEFDVRHRAGALLVTVRRGVVQVAALADGGGEAARLTPGQQLAHQDGAAGVKVAAVDPDAAFAWKSGRLIYRDQPLPQVVADLNRYFDTPIRLDGGAAGLTFSGVLVVDKEDAVVRRLQTFLPVVAETSPAAITLKLQARSAP